MKALVLALVMGALMGGLLVAQASYGFEYEAPRAEFTPVQWEF